MVETWNDVLTGLEEQDVVANLISVDFSKAFNRMNHFRCLEALTKLGAAEETVLWVSSFLFGRTMSVKIGKTLSSERTVPGGSPQGSIQGNYLFCATTNCFTDLNGNKDNNASGGASDEDLITEYIREIEEYNVISSPGMGSYGVGGRWRKRMNRRTLPFSAL